VTQPETSGQELRREAPAPAASRSPQLPVAPAAVRGPEHQAAARSPQRPAEPRPAAPARGVYLDYAAATPLDPEVLEAMLPYLTERFYNPSAPYALAHGVRDELEAARATLAHLVGGRPDNVTLTAGATEANNLAVAAASPGAHVVTDAIEHESVLACVEARPHAVVGVGPDGRVDPDAVARAITPETELVTIGLANGEIGTVQPLREVARVVAAERERRLEAGEGRPIWLHTDASQAAGHLSVNVSTLGVDLMTLSAAKVYGPKQVGLLWAADGVALRPLVLGGGQEGGVRSGTESVAGAVGFARALELAQARRATESRRLQGLSQRARTNLAAEFPWAIFSGPTKPKRRLPNIVHVSFPGVEARRLVIALERMGVSVGTGSACAASRMRVSHVLDAIGLPRWASEGSLRLALGAPTTEKDVDLACACIARAVHAEYARIGAEERELAAGGAERLFGAGPAAGPVAGPVAGTARPRAAAPAGPQREGAAGSGPARPQEG
jgi:cysteine desulfurase